MSRTNLGTLGLSVTAIPSRPNGKLNMSDHISCFQGRTSRRGAPHAGAHLKSSHAPAPLLRCRHNHGHCRELGYLTTQSVPRKVTAICASSLPFPQYVALATA
jgi:hypothetical protein